MSFEWSTPIHIGPLETLSKRPVFIRKMDIELENYNARMPNFWHCIPHCRYQRIMHLPAVHPLDDPAFGTLDSHDSIFHATCIFRIYDWETVFFANDLTRFIAG